MRVLSAKGSIFSTTVSDFKSYLKLERSLSDNTIAGYISDCKKLFNYLETKDVSAPEDANVEELSQFLESLPSQGLSKRSQARVISSIKALYKFLDSEGRLKDNPCDKIDTPKINPHLPTVLSVEEVVTILNSVDLSKSEGQRNRTIIEVLYSCGLRVSELVNLRISDLFLAEQFIRVTGKGSKQRIVPIGEPAIKCIGLYMEQRRLINVKKGAEDILFLNRRGGRLTRNMIFILVKRQAAIAGITKEISPHTFRHSFASHLVENGADLRVVQEMLGHESILTTEIYTHIDTKKWHETILKFHPARNLK
ncbi:MAG: site-specific tyrosine recombinase XerD [Bacteroidales bacterium]|nr:site-specific tyrosine recombinase XerD [Bacteroidales bacterium]MDD3201214.1 site-specific tyrosine recombinase XerD [Bacteroidales bacterium]